MSTTQDAGQVYALLSDGTTVEIKKKRRWKVKKEE